jgi:predicted N-acetyltransferase YhbS
VLRQPATCFVGLSDAREVVGFCCYDATARGMVGPVGVRGDMRGRGLARKLLRQTISAMRHDGYACVVIGLVSDEGFYPRLCGAVPIEGSHPGIFACLISEGI